MSGMSDKAATILMVLFISATMLMCLCYAALFVMPEVTFNPYKPSQATAWAEATLQAMRPVFEVPTTDPPTATSIFGPTWTPSPTPTASVTPTPTETRTPTPTSSPTPTNTTQPTATGTPLPTSTPPPPPTATPPPPYSVGRVLREPNCEVVRIKGNIVDNVGLPVAGVVLQVGEVNVAGSVFNTAPTDANGFYVWDFGSPNKDAHTWFVVPLENGQIGAASRFEFKTDSSDVCEFTSAVQIVTVDWRRRPDAIVQ